jgi:hypothetical protein
MISTAAMTQLMCDCLDVGGATKCLSSVQKKSAANFNRMPIFFPVSALVFSGATQLVVVCLHLTDLRGRLSWWR